MMRLQQTQTLCQAQLLLLPGSDKIELAGDADDLLTLLSDEPQVRDNRLRYVVGGGWAVELLTGVSRPHKDLDILQMSNTSLGYVVDSQRTTNYFQALSYEPNEVIEKYVRKVTWHLPNQPEGGQAVLDVYVLDPKFLLVSKLVGFARSPREKDLHDIQALSLLLSKQRCISSFEDLLNHVPFLGRSLASNRQMLVDLLGTKHPRTLREPTTRMAARFLETTVKLFSTEPEQAMHNAHQFVTLLTASYNDGLKSSFSASDLGIRTDLLESSIRSGKLKGVWHSTSVDPELRIFLGDGASEELHRLKVTQEISTRIGLEISKLEQLQGSLWIGTLAHPLEDTHFIWKEESSRDPLLCKLLLPIGVSGRYAAVQADSVENIIQGQESSKLIVLNENAEEDFSITIPWGHLLGGLRTQWGGERYDKVDNFRLQSSLQDLLVRDRLERFSDSTLLAADPEGKGALADIQKLGELYKDQNVFSMYSGTVHEFFISKIRKVFTSTSHEQLAERVQEEFGPLAPLFQEGVVVGSAYFSRDIKWVLKPESFESRYILACKSVSEPIETGKVFTFIERFCAALAIESEPLFAAICYDGYKREAYKRFAIALLQMLPEGVVARVRDSMVRIDIENDLTPLQFESANEYLCYTGRELTQVRRRFAADKLRRAFNAVGWLDDQPDKITFSRYLRQSMEFCGRTKARGVAPYPHYHESDERWSIYFEIAKAIGVKEFEFLQRCRERHQNYFEEESD